MLGHAGYYTVSTKFGGIYFDGLMSLAGIGDTVLHGLISKLGQFIYTFHMPAFIALSGVFFRRQMNAGKWNSVRQLAGVKERSLIYPMLFVWLVWNLPIKYYVGYYEGQSVWKWFAQIIIPYNVYLWYLEALFFCFIGAWYLERCTLRSRSIIVPGAWAIGVLLQYKWGAYAPLGNPMKWLAWFEVGMHLEELEGELRQRGYWIKRTFILMAAVWMACYGLRGIMPNKVRYALEQTILPMLTMIILIYCSELLSKVKMSVFRGIIGKISLYGMGIYLWAEPLNYLILEIVVELFGVAVLGSEVGAAIVFLLRIGVTPVVAVLITWLLRKIRFAIKAY